MQTAFLRKLGFLSIWDALTFVSWPWRLLLLFLYQSAYLAASMLMFFFLRKIIKNLIKTKKEQKKPNWFLINICMFGRAVHTLFDILFYSKMFYIKQAYSYF